MCLKPPGTGGMLYKPLLYTFSVQWTLRSPELGVLPGLWPSIGSDGSGGQQPLCSTVMVIMRCVCVCGEGHCCCRCLSSLASTHRRVHAHAFPSLGLFSGAGALLANSPSRAPDSLPTACSKPTPCPQPPPPLCPSPWPSHSL